MHYAQIGRDYAAPTYNASILSDCLMFNSCPCCREYCFHFFFFPFLIKSLYWLFSAFQRCSVPSKSSVNASALPLTLSLSLSLYTAPSLFSLFSFSLCLCLCLSFPELLLRASGCLPTSDVLLARWCMHISCVFLTLTRVDICTALWDSALGYISRNDENDDGDENSERKEKGGPLFFCPRLFFTILSSLIGSGGRYWAFIKCKVLGLRF